MAGLLGFVVAWDLAARHVDRPTMLPAPADVAGMVRELVSAGTLWPDVAASLKRVLSGFAIAAIAAVPLALVLATVSPLRRVVLPVLSVLRPIPPIAWIPLSILWFGIGDRSSYFITAVAAFFPIFINSLAGGLAPPANCVRAAQSLGASRGAVLLHVVVPSALPTVWTGLKIGLGQSWMAVVTSELIAAQSGLGFMIQVNRLNLETAAVLVGMLTIGILGALTAAVLTLSERWMFPWRTP